MQRKRYVIIGMSAAGFSVINKLRELDKDSEIIGISKEKEIPYNKCILAKYLAKKIEKDKVLILSQEKRAQLEQELVTIMLGKTVEQIVPSDKAILLEDGEKIIYDKLFVSTGASAIVPDLIGLTKEALEQGCFTFHTLEDVQHMLAFIDTKKPKRAVIIGAGMTGVECADALVTRGLQVTIVDRGTHVLGRQSDKSGAEIIQAAMEQQGIRFISCESVTEVVYEDERLTSVVLSSGEFLAADMLIFAVGVKPNIGLAQDAGIEIGECGIYTDEYMQTTVKDIYAGGDAAQVQDFISGSNIRSCTWSDACAQGMIAASNMAGNMVAYKGAMSFVFSKFFGIKIASCIGAINHKSKYEEFEKKTEQFYHKIFLERGMVKGFLLIGDVGLLGVLNRALQLREKIDPVKLYKSI